MVAAGHNSERREEGRLDQRWLRDKPRRPSSGLTHAWLDRVPANFPPHTFST